MGFIIEFEGASFFGVFILENTWIILEKKFVPLALNDKGSFYTVLGGRCFSRKLTF